MAADDMHSIRTIGLLAEGGAGKTTLGEALLYAAGETTRQGRVEDESSVFDFEPEEMRRKTTLSTAFHTLHWKKHDICLVDPPGYANFLPDTPLCHGGDGRRHLRRQPNRTTQGRD